MNTTNRPRSGPPRAFYLGRPAAEWREALRRGRRAEAPSETASTACDHLVDTDAGAWR